MAVVPLTTEPIYPLLPRSDRQLAHRIGGTAKSSLHRLCGKSMKTRMYSKGVSSIIVLLRARQAVYFVRIAPTIEWKYKLNLLHRGSFPLWSGPQDKKLIKFI